MLLLNLEKPNLRLSGSVRSRSPVDQFVLSAHGFLCLLRERETAGSKLLVATVRWNTATPFKDRMREASAPAFAGAPYRTPLAGQARYWFGP